MSTGIAVAGIILVDALNEITAYPQAGELTQIQKVSRAVGGCVPNVAIDIKRVAPNFKVWAMGRVGNDDNGAFVKNGLNLNGVDTAFINSVDEQTSFTQVLSVIGGQRTFFTYAGASAGFGFDDIPWDNFPAKALHLGYFLLLDRVDNGDGLRILQEAQRRGIKTSIDLVSENANRYGLVLPCLPFVDNLIINEIEASGLTGLAPTIGNLQKMAEKLKAYGVKECVIIHTSSVSVCLSQNGYTALPSFALPKGFIKGTTGAGDAFCAGCLIAIERGESDEDILALGSVCATGALSQTDAVSGVKTEKELKEICKNMERIQCL